MSEKAAIDVSKNSQLKMDYVTLVTMFVQIRAFNEVILKNQAAILAKLNNEDRDDLYKSFQGMINKEVADELKMLQ